MKKYYVILSKVFVIWQIFFVDNKNLNKIPIHNRTHTHTHVLLSIQNKEINKYVQQHELNLEYMCCAHEPCLLKQAG